MHTLPYTSACIVRFTAFVQCDSLEWYYSQFQRKMYTQTLKVHSALTEITTIKTKTTTSETTVCHVLERWQSWPTICFPICFRLHCCLPAHSSQPRPSLCRVFSFFLLRQTGHITLSQLGTLQCIWCIWFYCLYTMQSKYSSLHGVCQPPYIIPVLQTHDILGKDFQMCHHYCYLWNDP